MKETEIRLRDLGVAGAIMGEQIIAELVAECETLEMRLKEAEIQTLRAQEDAVRHAQRKAELSDLVAASWGGKYEQEVYDALHEKIAALRQRVTVLEAALAWRTGDEVPHEEGWYQTLNWGMYGHLYFSGGRWSRYPVPPGQWRPVTPPPTGEDSNNH